MFSCVFCSTENVPVRNSDVDYRLLEAAKAGDLDTVKVFTCCCRFYHQLDRLCGSSCRQLLRGEKLLSPRNRRVSVESFHCNYWHSFKCSQVLSRWFCATGERWRSFGNLCLQQNQSSDLSEPSRCSAAVVRNVRWGFLFTPFVGY